MSLFDKAGGDADEALDVAAQIGKGGETVFFADLRGGLDSQVFDQVVDTGTVDPVLDILATGGLDTM